MLFDCSCVALHLEAIMERNDFLLEMDHMGHQPAMQGKPFFACQKLIDRFQIFGGGAEEESWAAVTVVDQKSVTEGLS